MHATSRRKPLQSRDEFKVRIVFTILGLIALWTGLRLHEQALATANDYETECAKPAILGKPVSTLPTCYEAAATVQEINFGDQTSTIFRDATGARYNSEVMSDAVYSRLKHGPIICRLRVWRKRPMCVYIGQTSYPTEENAVWLSRPLNDGGLIIPAFFVFIFLGSVILHAILRWLNGPALNPPRRR